MRNKGSSSAPHNTGGSAASPSSPVAVPSLLLSDLPRVPRPLSLLFAFVTLFGGANGAVLTVMAAVSTVCTLLYSGNTDARSHAGDPPRGGGIVTDVDLVKNKQGQIMRSVVTARADFGGEVVSHFSQAPLAVGARVTIAGDDNHLVIVGGRLREHDRFEAYVPVAINAILGAMLLLLLLGRLRLLHVLRSGYATTGRIIERIVRKSKEGTTTTLVFAFTDGDGRARKHRVAAERFLEDDAQEPLLCTFLFCALLDDLPGRPRLENGRFVPSVNDGGVLWAIAGAVALAVYPLLVLAALTLPYR
jgi:hypothetical protein